MRPRLAVATVSALALVATAAACSKNTGGQQGSTQDEVQQTSVIASDPKDSMGPAPAIPGAVKGGTLRLLTESDFVHLDPQRTYTFAGMATLQMITRTLTVFREDGQGKLTLVGDLAENPGKDVNGDCKTWEYTLKKGIKFEDGREVKAADVAYGIARSFEETIDGGPTYIQEWLADDPVYNRTYKGPYTSGTDQVPGLEVKGDYQLVFNFKRPQCDLPYALALPTSAPVPKDKDTRTDYDRSVVSSGPYKIKEYVKDTRLVLDRNPHWDPNTDPLRHDYPDEIVIEMGPDAVAATERVIAGHGDDQYAVAWDEVPQSLVNRVLTDPALASQRIHRNSPSVWYLTINTERITDVNVRRAIAYAIDKQGLLATQGGEAAGQVIHTILPTTTIGRVDYPNPYDGGPNGDPEKAKELLGGKKVKLVFLSRTSRFGQTTAPIVKESLERAGFEVVVSYNEDAFSTAKKRGNEYDLYLNNWGADWPSAVSTIPMLFDGRKLAPQGNSNVSYLNAPDVNAEIDRVLQLPASEAAAEWAKVDQMIMEKYCPAVPLYQTKTLIVHGAKVGGLFVSDQFGTLVFYNAHIKQ